MMKRLALILAVPALAAVAVLVGGIGGPTQPAAAGVRLYPFGDCAELLAYVKPRALAQVQPWGLGWGGKRWAVGDALFSSAPRAMTPGTDFSTTNVQEEGVDEPDLVKTDGDHLFVVRGRQLFSVDVRFGKPEQLDLLRLTGWSQEILLSGDRLLVLANDQGVYMTANDHGWFPYSGKTTLTEVDVSDPSALRVVRTLSFDGGYVSARLTGSTARVVTTAQMPQRLRFTMPEGPQGRIDEKAALALNRRAIEESQARDWLPRLTVKDAQGEKLSERALVDCADIRRPPTYSGLELLSVLTIDLTRDLEPVDTDSVVASGSTVYASTDNLYVATQPWAVQPLALEGTGGQGAPPKATTAIHKFAIDDPKETAYRGSGKVDGYLLSQWAMSEHEGVLRVASTEEPSWWSSEANVPSQSAVTTLREDGDKLVEIGRVGGLGKGERIYAIRFIGELGYVVTFRQVDPLYVLDLSEPKRPRVRGELKIRGYSAYLHPLGDDLLLGVGQDASVEGVTKGTQLSIFEVSDPGSPRRLHRLALGPSYSEAEWDHHAFLYWPRERMVVLPLDQYGEQGGYFGGAVAFRAERDGLAELARVNHPTGQYGSTVRRSLVVGDTLYTVGDAGVKATALGSFAERGWLPFEGSP
jgi:uncharacterized secreted protein with C-terminal beta-propeller domain